MKVTPASIAAFTTATDSSNVLPYACPSMLWPPVPRQATLTSRPVRPSVVWSMVSISVPVPEALEGAIAWCASRASATVVQQSEQVGLGERALRAAAVRRLPREPLQQGVRRRRHPVQAAEQRHLAVEVVGLD